MRFWHNRARACALGMLLGLLPAFAHAQTYVLPADGDVIGSLQRTIASETDTLVDIALRHGVGYEQLRLANPGVDPWLPGAGTEILLPVRYILPDAPRVGVVLNLPEMRLYHYAPGNEDSPPRVTTFPVSIGRMDWHTPLGETRITAKVKDPSWYPPESIRAEHAAEGDPLPEVVPPGPDNPLGRFALRLGIPGGYLLHGTNKIAGIGMRVSHGCVRLNPDDIEALFERVQVGTPVRIVNQPFKVGVALGTVYFEVHPPLEEDAVQAPLSETTAFEVLRAVSAQRTLPPLRWSRVRDAVQHPLGIPVPISVGSPTLQEMLSR